MPRRSPRSTALQARKNNPLSSPSRKMTRQQEAQDSLLLAAVALRPSGVSDSEEEVEEKVESDQDEVYEFNGTIYHTYQEMVQAKRERNQQRLRESGLLDTARHLSNATKSSQQASQRGLKRKKNVTPSPTTRRKSNRLQGIASDGLYVQDERSGKFTVATTTTHPHGTYIAPSSNTSNNNTSTEPEFFRGRLNDGSDMTLEEAATRHVADKWLTDNAVHRAHTLCQQVASLRGTTLSATLKDASPRDNVPPDRLYKEISVDNPNQVAKVVPERIYGMAIHPSLDQLVVCAGDKQGHVGLWKATAVDREIGDDEDAVVHLFKYHSGAAASLQWTSDGRALFSTSYDGTCRLLDVNTETVRSLFAAYNDENKANTNQPGYGLDLGYHYYTQFGCLDHRQEDCFFVSSSLGSVYHIDSRITGRHALTWQHELSEKKINTVSLHPNGYALATGGLDCQVYLWDVRTFGSKTKKPKAIHAFHGVKSINSAFFSPSGNAMVTTTMHNKLDILHDFHLQKKSKGPATVKPTYSIRHDNMTGRWLTTFQAVWHPVYDIFGVGSMSKPRVVEMFRDDKRKSAVGGEALTAVVSRLAFHPRTDRIILAGGNSSGRVTLIR